MNMLSRLSSKGQIVIPKDVRDALGWTEGQEIVVRKSGDRAVLELPAPAKRERISWEEFERVVPRYEGPPVSIEEMNISLDEMWRARASERR